MATPATPVLERHEAHSATVNAASPARTTPDATTRQKRRGRPTNPSSAPIAQVNARVDADLKEQGDAALERAGFTPTTAIRALWRLAIQLDNQPGALADLLEPDRARATDEELAERARKVALAQKGAHIVSDCLERMGIRPNGAASAVASLSLEEMRELAYEERLKEKELWG